MPIAINMAAITTAQAFNTTPIVPAQAIECAILFAKRSVIAIAITCAIIPVLVLYLFIGKQIVAAISANKIKCMQFASNLCNSNLYGCNSA